MKHGNGFRNSRLLSKVSAIVLALCLVISSVPFTVQTGLAKSYSQSQQSEAIQSPGTLSSADTASESSQETASGTSAESNSGSSRGSDSGSSSGSTSASSSKAQETSGENLQESAPSSASSDAQDSGGSTEEALPSNLNAFDLVEAPEISNEQMSELITTEALTAPLSLLSGAEASLAEETPSEGGGSKIESISVEWITEDSTEDGNASRLSLKPGNDDAFSVRMRLNLALSGENEYDEGCVQISIPKTIFEDRDGRATGTMSLSVPEAPGDTAVFNYTDMGDYYLLANTHKLSAATSAMFEFTVKDLIPHTIVDGVTGDNEPGYEAAYVSDPFEATVQVSTQSGQTIARSSNAIDCVIDTSEKVYGASTLTKTIYESWPDSWPESLKPENAEDYIYVDWYSYAKISGNQTFGMTVKVDAQSDVSPGAKLLGYKDSPSGTLLTPESGSLTELEGSVFADGYKKSSDWFNGHSFVAYPKADFENDKTYTLTNTVSYILTDTDDGTISTTSTTGSLTYAPVSFQEPSGHFDIEKEGSGKTQTTSGGKFEGVYNYALNQIMAGKNPDLDYDVDVVGFCAPWTRAKDADPEDPASYNERSVKMVATDSETYFNYSSTALSSDDFEFKSLQVNKPTMYVYQKFTTSAYGYYESGGKVIRGYISAGSYGYAQDEDPASTPAIDIYGKSENGEWVHYATVDWSSGTAKSSAYNGAVAVGSTVNFPANVVDYKAETSTKSDGMVYNLHPTLTLKASDSIKAQVQDLCAKSSEATTKMSNKVYLDAYEEDGTKIVSGIQDTGHDNLSSASMAVQQTKSLTYKNDASAQLVRLHYSSQVYEQTGLADLDNYKEAIEAGAISEETSGTFYDLLPKGVIPDVDSITLREGDTVTGVKVIENYRDSGRTLLVVNANLTPQPTYIAEKTAGLSGYCDRPTISFDATYSWSDLKDYGTKLENVISFESGNEGMLGTVEGYQGEPDDPTAGYHNDSKKAVKGVEDLMTDLDPNSDANSFVYARDNTNITVDTSAVSSLTKKVSVNGGVWGSGIKDNDPRNVYEGGSYTYLLRMENTSDTSSKNIILYDNLETYVPGSKDDTGAEDKGDTQWKGSFVGADVSQLTDEMNIDAVVYYSTKEGLVLDEQDRSADRNLSDTNIWSTTCPADPSTVTAIAVDATKAKDGSDYVLPKSESISVKLHMKAPLVKDIADLGQEAKWYDSALEEGETEAGLTGGAHAYNNTVLTATLISPLGTESPNQLIRYDYVKVGLLPFKLVTQKAWNDEENRDGMRPERVAVHLYANGVDTGKSAVLSAENSWSFNWTEAYSDIKASDDKGNSIYYTFVEDTVSGYTLSVNKTTDSDGSQRYTLTNTHTPEKTTVSGVKTWDDNNDAAGKRPNTIKVNLYADGSYVTSKNVMPSSDGSWSYSFTNLDKYQSAKVGELIDYTIEEEYVAGYISGYGGDGSIQNIQNTYSPYGDLTISKQLKDETEASADKEFSFTLTVLNESGEPDSGEYTYITSDGRSGTVACGGSLSLKGGQTATVKNLPSEQSYRVEEVESSGFSATSVNGAEGVIRAGKTAEASFENTYTTSGSLQVKAQKVLSAHSLSNRQFSFQLLDESGNVVKNTSCGADGSIVFGLVKYSNADDGNTYTYYLREKVPDAAVNADGVRWSEASEEQKDAGGFSYKGYTYDTAKRKISVKVSDNGDGTMSVTPTYYDAAGTKTDTVTVNNVYKASGTVSFNLWKTLKGRDLKENEFSFGLYYEDGSPVTDGSGTAITAKNAADGKVSFPDLGFSEKDAGNTYTYIAKEIIPSKGDASYDATVVYDASEWKYELTVHDNDDGTLSFDQKTIDKEGVEGNLPVIANTLNPGSLTLTKTVENGDENKDFKFKVKLTSPIGEKLDGEYSFTRTDKETQNAAIAEESDLQAASGEDGDGLSIQADTNNAASVHNQSNTFSERLAEFVSSVSGEDVDSEDEYASADIAQQDAFAEMLRGAVVSLSTYGALQTDRLSETEADDTSLQSDSEEAALASGSNEAGLQADGDIASGTCGTCTWVIDAAGVLTIKPTSGTEGTLGIINGHLGDSYWSQYRESITSAKIEGTVHTTKSVLGMFYGCRNMTTVNLSGLDTSNASSFGYMFSYCSSLTSLDLTNLDTSNATDMSTMFFDCSSLTSLDLTNLDTSKVTNMGYMFENCSSLTSLDVANLDTSKVTNMRSMFSDCSSLTSLDLTKFNTVNVTDMNRMFENCSSLTSLDVAKFDTANVTNMILMFYGCKNLTSLDVTKFNTAKVTNLNSMFSGCSSLTSLDVSNFDTSSAIGMNAMFYSCSRLASLDLTSFDTSKVTGMGFMFSGCSSLTSLDVAKFNTVNVTNMNHMFENCDSLTSLDLTSFDTSNVTDMSNMFNNDLSLSKINLGENFSFKGKESTVLTTLPDAPTNKTYSGKWAYEEDPSIAALSAANLAEVYPDAATAPVGVWVWEKNPTSYTVIFDSNGGSGSMGSLKYEVDTEYTLPAHAFYQKGKTFSGWNTKSDGTGVSYADCATVTNLTLAGESLSLYAQWKDDATSGTVTDGEMEVIVHGNESLTVSGIPAATQYQVYEETPSGWVLVSQSDTSGTIESLANPEAKFVNKYQPGSVQATIVGTKVLQSATAPIKAGDYSFELYDSNGKLVEKVSCGDGGSVAFSPLTYTEAGINHYTVKEVAPASPGYIRYDTHEEEVYVEVSDDGNGVLSASVSYLGTSQDSSKEFIFRNTDTTPTKGELLISKTVEGSSATDVDFTFNVELINKGVRETKTLTVQAGQSVSVGEFDAGTVYTVSETNIPAGYSLVSSTNESGTIEAGKSVTASFSNAYAATGSAALKATKVLTDGTLEAGQFSFVLKDKDGKTVQTLSCEADGSVIFEPISYTSPGDYSYTISEVVPTEDDPAYDGSIVYDTHTEEVQVNVVDRGDGTLATYVGYDETGAHFSNKVKPGSIELSKKVTGATAATATKVFRFEVTLTDSAGVPLEGSYSYERSDGKIGSVASGDIVEIGADQSLSINDIPASTNYTFTEYEADGYTIAESTNVTGTVKGNKTVTASVTNAYSATGTWIPEATKVLTGAALSKDQFKFMLMNANGAVTETVSNDEKGRVSFTPITFTEADDGNTYTYTIAEEKGSIENVVYDTHSAQVSVRVTDKGDGTMEITPTYGTDLDNGPVFTNNHSVLFPSTGSLGPETYFALGATCILLSLVALIARRRQTKR